VSAVAVPADRRFRRAHVKPSRRRQEWRRVVAPVAKYAVVTALVLLAIYRGGTLVAGMRMLQVNRIIVHGNERLSRGQVISVLDGLRGDNILTTDLDGWRQRLLNSPWIADASLRRSLPSTVEVTVSERQPFAIARLHGDMYLMDEHGVVIAPYGPQYADLDMPIVDGLPSPNERHTTDEARAELASRVISAIHESPQLRGRLSQVDVSDVHDAAVLLDKDPAVIRLGEDQFVQRLTSYLDLSEALRERVPEIDYVDLRFDDRVYVRPAGKTSRTRSGDPAATRPAVKTLPHAAARPGRKRR
jgi:cell division protein FtsQ